MAILLTRYGNIDDNQSPKNLKRHNRKIRVKTHPELKRKIQEVKESIEKSKVPEKVVKIKTLRNLPRNASATTKEFLKAEPKNINPQTGRKRNWTYEKYPAILPPPKFIRKVARSPKPTLVGRR